MTSEGSAPHKLTRTRRWQPAVCAPSMACILIVLLDRLLTLRDWNIPLRGLMDEPAHLLTAALVMSSFPRGWLRGRWPWALIGSVAIDLDHIPMYTFARGLAEGGRPPTHSLATVAVLTVLGVALSRRGRVLVGLAMGVGLHLVRDAATGPGIPLLWPASGSDIVVPYLGYACWLAVATCIATWRLLPGKTSRRAARVRDNAGYAGDPSGIGTARAAACPPSGHDHDVGCSSDESGTHSKPLGRGVL